MDTIPFNFIGHQLKNQFPVNEFFQGEPPTGFVILCVIFKVDECSRTDLLVNVLIIVCPRIIDVFSFKVKHSTVGIRNDEITQDE